MAGASFYVKKTAIEIEHEKLESRISQRIDEILSDPEQKEKLICDMESFGDKSRFKQPKYR